MLWRKVEDMGTKKDVGKRLLSDIVHFRSAGETAVQTARHLGLVPWQVSYLTRFLKVCVTHEEHEWLLDEMERWGFSTVGEFIMDVFNRCYEESYSSERRRKVKGLKTAS